MPLDIHDSSYYYHMLCGIIGYEETQFISLMKKLQFYTDMKMSDITMPRLA